MKCIIFFAALGLSMTVALAQSELQKQAPPNSANSGSSSGNLSQKLNQTNGVIRPQGDVDPGMTKAAPNPNPDSTPVIPPPGGPGGNRNVQPK